MEIKFKNGSYIKTIDSNENLRSNKSKEFLDVDFVDKICEMLGIKLLPYQKLYLYLGLLFNRDYKAIISCRGMQTKLLGLKSGK